MVLTDREALLDALRAEAGDSIRVIATYDRDGYEPVYVRDDLTARLILSAKNSWILSQ